jgi:hypothetical protein
VLAALGVTVIELMPVAAFPGTRNWGYDGAALSRPPPATARQTICDRSWTPRTSSDSP